MTDIIICEDNLQELEELQALLSQELPLFFSDYTLHTYTSGQTLCQDIEKQKVLPQLVFLDILLGDFSGLNVAKALRAQNIDSQLVFITSSREYVMESYYYCAAYYILKPVNRDWLHRALTRVTQSLQQKEKYLVLKKERDELRIPQSSIHYVETFGNKTFIHTEQKVFSVYKPLKEIAADLDADQFLMIQRGILSNLSYVDTIQNNVCTLKNGKSFSLSRKNSSALKEKYFDFLFQNQ